MDVLSKVKEAGLVPVFFNQDKEIALSVVKACYEAGVRGFEFTNRGAAAIEVFKYLVKHKADYPEMALGIGTIMDKAQAQSFIDMGTDFIVCPILDQEVAELCRAKEVPWIPGCGTLTEIITGQRWGADLVKIFPASVLGPAFVKAVLGPCPQLQIMPTGGVAPTEENLQGWFGAGVVCVGMGSKLFNKELIQTSNYPSLVEKLKNTLSIIQAIRS